MTFSVDFASCVLQNVFYFTLLSSIEMGRGVRHARGAASGSGAGAAAPVRAAGAPLFASFFFS